MLFLSPLFLWGIGLVSVPVIIHFLSNPHPGIIEFSFVKFIKRIDDETKYRRRLKDILLLLARTLIILLIVLAFARPAMKKHFIPSLSKEKPHHYVVLLDRSASMGYNNGKGMLLERGKEFILKLQKNMHANDVLSIISFAKNTKKIIDRADKSTQLDSVLRNIDISPSENDFYKAFLRADREFSKLKRMNHVLCLLSDLQAYGFEDIRKIGRYTFIERDVHLKIIPLNEKKIYNHYIKRVETDKKSFYPGKEITLNVITSTTQAEVKKPFQMEFFVDGKKTASATVKEKSTLIKIVLNQPGRHRCKIKLENDPLLFDNVYEFDLYARELIRIGVYSGDDSRVYLQKALNPFNSLKKTNFIVERLKQRTPPAGIKKFNVILWDKLDSPDINLVRETEKYVRAGGNLVIFPGGKLNIQVYNILLNKKSDILPGEIIEKSNSILKIKPDRFAERIFHYFDSDFYQTGFTGQYRFKSVPEQDVLFRFENGVPFLIEHRVGKGKALFANMINSRKNGLFVLNSFYPVFINQLITYLTEPGQEEGTKSINHDIFSRESGLRFSNEEEIRNLVTSKSIAETGENINSIVSRQSQDKQKIWRYFFMFVIILLIVEYSLLGMKN